MSYIVNMISAGRKDELLNRNGGKSLYEVKSEIYGCCIKLLTDSQDVKERWEESFYFISQNIRSHGRLYVISDPSFERNAIFYHQLSRTAFLVNVDYYGWIKSLALSVAGDILEDEHSIYSVHGACLDANGKGICLVGGSGAGKTTHTYGLLRHPAVRAVSDDWFFARIFDTDIIAYGSEKNFYIRSELAGIWPEFAELVGRSKMDQEGRGVIDLRFAIGKGRILPLTTLRHLIILHRVMDSSSRSSVISSTAAMSMIRDSCYFNPHLIVKDEAKGRIRDDFFMQLLRRVKITLINTAGTPEESQDLIREAVGLR